MSQSAVSQHIKDLEASIGRQLFQRGWRGVQLTAHGAVLHGYGQQILGLIAQAETALTDVEHLASGKVSIGATPGIAVYLAPDWVQRFRGRYPHLSAALQTGITAQIISEVLNQRLDVGFIEGELDGAQSPRLAWLPLKEIEQKVVVGFRHAWWDRQQIALAELHRQSFIMRQPNSQSRIWLDATLAQYGIEPQIGAEFDNLEAAKRAVIAGACLAILPEYAVQHEVSQGMLHALEIEHRPLKRTLKLIWEHERPFSPITQAFLDELRHEFPMLSAMDSAQG
jgi:DNA-binding transcriptional LysR family regulator